MYALLTLLKGESDYFTQILVYDWLYDSIPENQSPLEPMHRKNIVWMHNGLMLQCKVIRDEMHCISTFLLSALLIL